MRPLFRLSILIAALTALGFATAAIAADPAAPEIELFSPADGDVFYQGQQVQAAWGCFPGTVGWPVVTCEGDLPLGALLDTSSVGTHTFSVHAVDYAGAETTVTHTYTVFDVVAPTATISAPAAGAEYSVGAQVYVSYSCDDGPGGSGIAGCIGTYANGFPLPTGRPGTFTFTVDAFDGAANTAPRPSPTGWSIGRRLRSPSARRRTARRTLSAIRSRRSIHAMTTSTARSSPAKRAGSI